MQLQRLVRSGLGLSVFFALAAGAAVAEVPLYPDEVERLDVISIQQDGRDVYAFDSVTGTRARVRLEVDEVVVFTESRGRIGVVLTDRRALGVNLSGNFQEVRYRIFERPPDRALVSQRLALVATSRRVIGFVGQLGGWVQEDFTPGEGVEAIRVGAAVGIATTNRRALGLAPDVPRFASVALRLRESVESIEAEDTLATLYTDQRILVFSGPRSIWTYTARQLR